MGYIAVAVMCVAAFIAGVLVGWKHNKAKLIDRVEEKLEKVK